MLGLEEFSRLASQIHASPVEPGSWDEVLGDLTRHLGATACTVAVGAGLNRAILSTNIDPEAAAAYAAYYHQMDFIMQSCESSPVGLVRSGRDGVTNEISKEFYVDWQRRFDMTDGIFVRLATSPPSSFIVSAPPRSEAFENPERIRVVNALVPHLRIALANRHTLLGGGHRPSDIVAATDVISHGLIVVSAGGRIVQMNLAARHIVSAGDGLRSSGNRVQASAAPADDALQAAVARALVRLGPTPRVSSHLLCGRASGKRPFILRVVPLDAYDDPAVARAVIVVIDPDRELRPPKAVLRQLFNLTAAETAVALQVLSGDGPQAIADKSAVSLATVKTQLQSIFRKTGTHRQADLVRLLVAIVP